MRFRAFLLGLCLSSATAAAAVPEMPRFRELGVADGLPSTSVPALARDREGYLWLATWDGLARYDGVGFVVWRHEPGNAASLPGNVVQALHIDQADRIWVATENGGLSVMDADRKGFRHYRKADHPEMGSDDVFAIASHGDELWFGTFGGGLHRLAQGKIERFAADEGDPGSLPSDNVISLACDAKGRLWAGTMGGLARYEDGKLQRVAMPVDDQIVYSVTAERDGVWIGTAAGVFQWQDGRGWHTPAWSAMFARPNAVMALSSDGYGEYWLAGQGGLWRTEGEGAPSPVIYREQRTGVGRVLQAVLLQPDGGMWVPLPTRGLGYLRSDWRRIAAFSTAQGLGGGLYRGLAQAGPDGIWLASSTGNIERLNTRTGDIVPLGLHQDVLQKLRLTSALQDSRGRLWLGHSNGLVRIDPATGELRRWENGTDGDGTPDAGSVDWLVEAPDGSLWLSTLMGRVQQRDIATGKVLQNVAAQSEDASQAENEAMALGPKGGIWLGGARGLSQWRGDRFVSVPEVGTERVLGLAFENADRLWLHRLSGLEAWQRSGAQGWRLEHRIGAEEGLPAVESTGIQVDNERRVWLATRRGLFRIDANLRGARGMVRNFGVRDGMISQEFNDRALLLTQDGLLAGAAADGSVMLLDTRLPDPAPVQPSLVLDAVQVSGADGTVNLQQRDGFELRPDDYEMQISMRLLSFENPLANRYRSWLEGLDRTWVEQGATGERAFSSLPPGNYVLRMQGFDAAGNASAERRLSFRVLPPWWRSAWGMVSFAALALLALGMLAAGYRRRVRRRSAWQLAEHKRELAEQASLAKTRFLATLGHEVRTPMTGVLGMSELLLGTPLTEQQRGYTAAIQRAGTHLLRLVNDALDLARIEAGKLELQELDFDLYALANDIVALMAPVAEKRGLAFADEIAAGVPRMVRGDPLRLRQILLNLIGNAIKFTDHGHVSLRIAPLSPEGVRLEISDTGPGINAEQQARLFRRFEQAEGASTTARYGGSGLGLAICQELAVAMGGRIDVDSAPGVGTRFIVDLPMPRSITAEGPADRPGQQAVVRHAQALRILLVEDDLTVAEVVAGLLRARGHHVVHGAHGLAALSEASVGEFDIALLDLDLPGLDGLALAQQLRMRGFAAPLVAITARADGEAESQAQAAGFDGFLRKPVTGDMLVEVIERALLKAGRNDAEIGS